MRDELGNVIVAPRKKPETPLEAAEQAFELAMCELEVAWVKLRGARERLEMIRAHEKWKELKNAGGS